MDTQWMLYETINTTTKGSAFKFVFEKLNVYSSNPVPIENFFIFTKQEHVKKLSAALSNAIKSLIQPVKLSEHDLSDVCLNFLQFMTNWSKGSLGGYYQLTKHHVLKQLTQLLLEPYVVKLTEPSTRAVVHRTDTWNQIIMNSDVTIINHADDLTVDFVLDSTTTMIEQHYKSVDDWWADNGDIIKQEVHAPKKTFNHIYHYLWRARKIPVLLEGCDPKHLCQIQDIIKFSQGIFRVVVLNKCDNPIENINTLKTFINIDSLSASDRKTILLQPFTLQGRHSLVPLKDLVDPRNVTHITAKDVIYILAQKFNIGDKPEPLPEFLEETSLLRVWFDTSVLLHISSEMFIVKCSNLGILKTVLQERNTNAPNLSILLWPDIKEHSEGVIIVYKAKKDLPEIEYYCSKKGKPFHQLAFYDSGNLEWIKSSGSVTNIKSFRRDSNATCEPLTKTELITDMIAKRKPTLVSSDPGMGKSVLINYIARNVPSSWWTLKLNLAEHRNVYNIWKTENPSEQLFNSFVSTLVFQKRITNSFEDVVFQRYFENKQVIFLLDGFDEIPVSYQNGAKKLITFISDAGYVLCLMTRPVLKIELESILNTFSVSMNLFTRINQENFLKNYFAREANSLTSHIRIKSFVNQLLNATERNLKDHDNLFVGVPLQTVLLAQVFGKSCVKYLQTGEFECKHFDLLFLYRHFFKEKLQISRTKVEGISEDSISHYKVCRSFYALQLIFSEDKLEELQVGKRLLQASEMFPLMIQLIQKDGIIVAEKENKVSFVHRTFAEYLAAEWLAENINGEYKAHAQRLIAETFQPSFEVVRNIFDRLMAQGCCLHLAIINRQISKIQEIINADFEVYKEKDKGGRIFLHIIASWGQHHPVQKLASMELVTLRSLVAKDDMMKILKLIPSSELMNNCKDNILNYTPLDYAIFSGALNVANFICARLNSPYYFELIKTLNNRKECMYKMNYNWLYNIFSKYGFNNSTLPQSICYKGRSLGKLLGAIEATDMNTVSSWISKQKNINVSDSNTGYTVLHMALIYDRPEIAAMLLHHKADSKQTDNSDRTPLHWALSKNMETATTKHQSSCQIDRENLSIKPFSSASSEDITLMLIDLLSKDGHIDIQDNDGNTALHLEAHNGHINAIKMLLCQGAYIEVKNSNGDTPLIISACRGRTDIVDLLLSWGVNKEAKNCYGYTALLAAILVGQTEMADFLLSKGLCIESKGNSGNTALLVAAAGGHMDIATLLLSHGSDINAKTKKNSTSLMLATFNGHIDTVNLLLDHGADIEFKRDNGHTALLVASYYGLSDIVSLLLSRGADKEAKNNEGNTALTIAVICRHVDVIEELLLWDVDKEAVDSDGYTALTIAAFRGYADVVNVLLSRGCNKEAANKQGEVSLILAAKNGHVDVVRLLLSNNIHIEAKSNAGCTALAAASDNGHIDVVRLLLSHNSDKEAENRDGNTPLLLAARNGHAEVVNLFISHGANREAKNWKGETALASAACEGHISIVNLLISLEADIEARTIEGATSLILAARKGHTDVVQFLLCQDSNKEAKTIQGDSALVVAARQGHLDVVKMLLSHSCDKNVKNNQGDTAAMAAASSGKIDVVRILCSEDSENIGHKMKFCIIS